MGSVFHQLCPRYSGTLTLTALTAIRLWETFFLSFKRIILKQLLTEANVYLQHCQGTKFARLDLSNVIYPKSSHNFASDAFTGENVNAMLE